jgi:hypothetical protein
MIHITRGRITDKWTVIGAWSDEMPLPDAYYFAIWFYDPRTDRLHEQYNIGDWLQLHDNATLWRPLQHWTIDRRISPTE